VGHALVDGVRWAYHRQMPVMIPTPSCGLPRPIRWFHSDHPVAYDAAVARMQAAAHEIAAGRAAECVWLLEHPPLYTAGTSARPQDLIDPQRFPVHVTGRGGQYTYHGPGQRIAYVMLDVKARGGDVRAFVTSLEGWLIDTLRVFGVCGEVRPGRVGVWVTRRAGDGSLREDKIAALGIRISRGVSMHGVSLNVAPELSHFSGIVPCGLPDHGVTSLADLGIDAEMSAVDNALRRAFEGRFGPVEAAAGDFLDGSIS
jgi:lipoyl(octanoyl) transferase